MCKGRFFGLPGTARLKAFPTRTIILPFRFLAVAFAIRPRLPALRFALAFRCRFLRFVAGNNIDGNQLFGEALDAFDVNAVAVMHQRNRQTGTPGATGTTDAVHIVFGKLGQIVVEDMRNTGNVETTSGHISRHQNAGTPQAHIVDGAIAGTLLHVAMQRGGGKTGDQQLVGDQVGIALGGGKHQRLMQFGIAQQMVKQAVLVRLIIDKMDALFDVFMLGGRPGNTDHHRLARQVFSQFADLPFQRGRKHHGLTFCRHSGNNQFNILDKTHVEHAVGFIEHQNFQLRKIDFAGIKVINQATRRRHQDFRILRQQLQLLGVRHAAQNGHHAQTADMRAIFVSGIGHLHGQFARWRQHQHARLCRLEARTLTTRSLRLAFLIEGFDRRQARIFGKTVDRRQHEGGRLAGTGLGRNDQIASGQRGRNGLLLNWSRLGITRVDKGLQHGLIQAEFGKVHVFFRQMDAARDKA
ncbi:MAG: hypothetical protein BWY57_02961 [Betaproteobacteria bacterium ADurb.Bin341]|nr:MAG: hypothetical protein BWY57_02961 [Betaproteobacteria bacterium ADurb.Bin341]